LANDFAKRYDLPTDKVWQSWETGPSKLFLNDLEHRFDVDVISHLHDLGVKVPIATTSMWGGNAIYSLPALTTGDIIDAHAYGQAFELERNPLISASMANWLSMSQVAGKPMSVTEWNVSPFPAPDRHTSPLYIASTARLQGWDAVMMYAYAQESLNDSGKTSNWQTFKDPALVSTLPAAALLYRQGHIREAETTYALTPTREQLFYTSISPNNSIAARTASERGKLVVVMPNARELPWLAKAPATGDAKVMQNIDESMIEMNTSEVISDTGEIRRNWKKGLYIINTPRSQAAMGRIGNEQIVLPQVQFDVITHDASVAVQSLDGLPISRSSCLMISFGAQAVPTGNADPFRSEPVRGQLRIHARGGLKLLARIPGSGEQFLTAEFIDGNYVVNLERSPETSWLFLKGKECKL
jgi:hypothetical protein